MILSPHAPYVMFEDNRKARVIQDVGSASITYVEWKFQQWQVQIMDRSQNISLHFICITFHLHYITFAFKNRATSA